MGRKAAAGKSLSDKERVRQLIKEAVTNWVNNPAFQEQVAFLKLYRGSGKNYVDLPKDFDRIEPESILKFEPSDEFIQWVWDKSETSNGHNWQNEVRVVKDKAAEIARLMAGS